MYIGRLYRHCNVLVFAGCFLQQVQSVGGTYPHKFLVFLFDVCYPFQSRYGFCFFIFEVYLFKVVVSSRPDIALAVLGDRTDILVGADCRTAELGGGKDADRTFFLVYLVNARTVASCPNDAGAYFAQGYERVVTALVFLVENTHKRMPLPAAVFVQADSVVGGIPQIALFIFDDGVYLVVDKGLFVTDGMLDPLVIAVPIVAYGNADRIICHPDAFLVVNVYVVDGIAVHGIAPVKVRHDVRFGLVGIYIHFIDARAVCRYQYLILAEGTDTVDADVCQSRLDMECFMEVEVIHINPSLKSPDKDFAAAFMEEKLVDLQF